MTYFPSSFKNTNEKVLLPYLYTIFRLSFSWLAKATNGKDFALNG